MKLYVLIFLLIFSTLFLSSQTLKITISGLRSTEGTVRLAFYNTSKEFDNDKAVITKTISKKSMVNGSLSVSYTGLKSAIYGIAILDDENNNEKMDYGLILPKEGFGFSDYYHTGMTRPKFESFDFILGSEIKTVQIKLRYM